MRLASFATFFLLCALVNGQGDFRWSDENKSNQSQGRCIAPKEYKNKGLANRQAEGNTFSDLGKVNDIQVCAQLCCEIDRCDLALLEKERCFAVKCKSVDSCELAPAVNTTSTVVTFRRISGEDIWTSGIKPNGDLQDKKPTFVTKQATIEKNPADTIQPEEKGSFITLSDKEQKAESPMDALLQKESSMIKDKQSKKVTPVKEEASAKKEGIPKVAGVDEKIQDLTDHYMKTQDKVDVTALQENDTSHISKMSIQTHRRDLRHTLISPITIGAFTCMAIIAVSGFAMAIIKYQKERKEFEDKTTQKP